MHNWLGMQSAGQGHMPCRSSLQALDDAVKRWPLRRILGPALAAVGRDWGREAGAGASEHLVSKAPAVEGAA